MCEHPNNLKVGDKVELVKSIYDHGEDHHPPCFLGHVGETVLVKEVYSDGTLSVHHDYVTDGRSFKVYKDEYKIKDKEIM